MENQGLILENTLPDPQSTVNAGRPKGSPNKATALARAAIAAFVDGNVERLQEWLDMVAHGYKVAISEKDGKHEFKLVPPNPEKAFTMFMEVVEYHIPKMKSIEFAGEEKPVLELRAQQVVTPEIAAQSYAELLRHVHTP